MNAFVSGGALPAKMRGARLGGLATVWDWYATFADVGGLPASALVDREAAAAGLPPVDAISLWPYVSGAVPESPRRQVVLGTGDGAANGIVADYSAGHGTGGGHHGGSDGGPAAASQANATGLWKLLTDDHILYDGWTGPECPNATYVSPPAGRCAPFCLYRLDQDPTEHDDLQPAVAAGADPVAAAVAADLLARVAAANATGFHPNRGDEDAASCLAAVETWGGYWGPWIGVV